MRITPVVFDRLKIKNSAMGFFVKTPNGSESWKTVLCDESIREYEAIEDTLENGIELSIEITFKKSCNHNFVRTKVRVHNYGGITSTYASAKQIVPADIYRNMTMVII